MGSGGKLFHWAGVTLLVLISIGVALGESTHLELNCTASTTPGVWKLCTAVGAIDAKSNVTYRLPISEEDAHNQRYDLNITLSPSIGDADMMITLPQGNATVPGHADVLTSARNIGDDILFIPRTDLISGVLEITVIGYSVHSNYSLTVEIVTAQRELRPMAAIALGQFFLECCKLNGSCEHLKTSSQLLDDTPDTNPNYCYMHGLLCSQDGYLLEMNLPNQDLVCELPTPLLHRFPRLNRLNLMGNQITGNITEIAGAMSEMNELKYLDLSGTMLTGPFDTACGLAATDRLQQLNLAQNAISGEIPSCIMGITDLVELHLDQNLLQGPIPEIPPTSKLVYFTASEQMGGFTGGGLTGTLPDSLPTLTRLTYLDLSGNVLTGPLPTSLPSSMVDFRVSYNYLGGTIPTTFGAARELRTLELGSNQLYGTIPPGLTQLANLRLLDLQRNNIGGHLPEDWSQAPHLVYLTLENNQLSGPLPASLAAHPSLSMLDISNNQMSGDLHDFQAAVPSPDSERPSSLWMLNLANNSFAGNIADADGMAHLGLFQPHTNPKFFKQIRNMQFLPRVLDISANDFQGTFPLWLVQQLATVNESIIVDLTGTVLTCPEHGFPLSSPPIAGALDGLHCYNAPDARSVDVFTTPMRNITELVFIQHHTVPVMAIAILVLAVLGGALVFTSCIMVCVSKCRQRSAVANSKFQAFEDALPEGKTFEDEEWSSEAHVEMGKPAEGKTPKFTPLSSLPQPRPS